MKLFGPLTLLLITLTSTIAFADHMYLVPNCCGDNFGYSTTINGHPVHFSGGTDPFFLDAFGYPPGSTLGFGELFLDSTVIWVGGIPTEFFFPGAGSISMFPTFTLPTDGRDFFKVFVDINFFHTGVNFDTGQTIDVSGGAFGSISFSRDVNGFYVPDAFVQAPEPGTLALLGTGLLGIAAAAKGRRRARTS